MKKRAVAMLRYLGAELGVRAAAQVLPSAVLRAFVRRATPGYGFAVCVHRVGHGKRRFNPAPEMTTTPETLDKLLELVDAAMLPGSFNMTVDDGYAEAVAYTASRAPLYPRVNWLVFVCPEKMTRRAGFRWDEYELRLRRNQSTPPFAEFMQQELDVDNENGRPALQDVAHQPEFELATVEACRRLARLPNVKLGGHTNAHFALSTLPDEDALRELRCSTALFEQTFGQRMSHFSFPYGSPGEHFADRHADYLRALRNPVMWSTEGRPFAVSDQQPGRVLPRFPFPGTWSAEAMVLWMALQAVRDRLVRRSRRPREQEARGSVPSRDVVIPAVASDRAPLTERCTVVDCSLCASSSVCRVNAPGEAARAIGNVATTGL